MQHMNILGGIKFDELVKLACVPHLKVCNREISGAMDERYEAGMAMSMESMV